MGVAIRLSGTIAVSAPLRPRLDALREMIERLLSQAPLADPARSGVAGLEFPFPTPAADHANSDMVAMLAAGAAELAPWSQGPFPLSDALTLGGAERDDERWQELDRQVNRTLAGRRALVVGCRSGYDAFALAARGAEHVLACEPSDAVRQAELLESAYRSGVEFRRADWPALDARRDGRFDIVHCDGLLHRVLEPIALLRKLYELTADDGLLLIGSMMMGDPERSELLRFVPGRHDDDPTWWFVPGRLAFRWMVQTAGFVVEAEFGEREGPRDGFPVVSGYLRARRER